MNKKRYGIVFAFCLFSFASVVAAGPWQKLKKAASEAKANAGRKGTQSEKTEKTEDYAWDSALDTARSVSYLDNLEKDVIFEMNKARSNPAKYAELYIAPLAKQFSGKSYKKNGVTIMTNEGAAAVEECARAMSSASSLPPLTPSEGLSKAAAMHAESQGLTNQTGHTGTDGSSPFDRMKRYGTYRTAGENVNYGNTTGRDIVVAFLIDDGVPSRGHRKNIMKSDFTHAGVGYFGRHKAFGSECVIDFAGGWKEK